MKRLLTILMCLFAMMAASMSAKAQEVAIELLPGWNWIAYPYAETVDLNTALGSFTPAIGDKIRSQYGASNYTYGRWRGAIQSMNAGEGYHYFSTRTEPVILVFGLPSIPMGTLTVTTSEPTNITSTTAVCGGSAVSNDGTTILMKGVCWATHPEPTTNDSYLEIESGPGTFTAEMTGLTPETVYYVRAYAVSVKGINYGEELSFTTVSPGILNGLFSVSENSQVCFSQGNLQYQASTNTWRFAENQWDCIREGNSNISSTYDGWIDLFNWGTSGYNHGANRYQPWSTSTDASNYYAYGIETCCLFDQTGKADWGYNAISNGGNEEKLWRTLSYDEWHYMLYERETSSNIRFAKAQVSGVNGLIILPDDWDASNYTLNYTNNGGASFDQNNITFDDWMGVFQDMGAAFLPCAGARYGNYYESYSMEGGDYWSSTRKQDGDFAYDINLGWVGHSCCNSETAQSVRLVRPAQANTSYSIEAVPNPAAGGMITGTGTYEYYTQVTLTATANEGYTFYQWKENGNVISTENTISFVALFDRSLEACFLETSTYPLLYSFNDSDHTATVIGHWDGQNASGDLVIPKTVMHNGETYTVTAIGSNAFVGYSGLTSVVIPNTVTAIGDDAFRDCTGLSSLSFGNTLTSIGERAFWHCEGLTSVVLPNSLVSIASEAFRYCYSLTEINIPSSVTSMGLAELTGEDPYEGNKNPFAACWNLANITVDPENAYYDSRDNCNAIIETATNKLVSASSSTIIPNTVTEIGWDAFKEIPISSITIPASVSYINHWAFSDISTLSSITVLSVNPPGLGEYTFAGINKDIPVYVPCGSIEAYQNANGWNEFTNFVELCSGVVTVTASPAEYGIVTGGGSFETGETCTVTAMPNEGYYFLCWMEDGQCISTEATYTFPVYSDRNLTAIFYATFGDENVINGDFEQGNVGFTSACVYNSYLWEQGTYCVDNDACLHHENFVGFGHGGTGNFMIVNGATNPETNIWTEQFTVVSNVYYVFSTWVCTVGSGSPALLQFNVNGTQIGDVFTAPSQTNTWQQFSVIWYSGNSTTATITILNQNTEGAGNDFGLDDISFRELDPSSGSDHAYVDLGLPSGLLWATCNVGAITPEGYGDYFAWGETQPKDYYDWGTYQYGDGTNFTKYNGSDGLTTLLPEDDAATANWGADWRMPTMEDWQELYNNTTCTWTQQNGVNGMIFTASNGNSLFLPAAGWRFDSSLAFAGSYGDYWSSSLYTAYLDGAGSIGFADSYSIGDSYRGCGLSVRAVRSSGQN